MENGKLCMHFSFGDQTPLIEMKFRLARPFIQIGTLGIHKARQGSPNPSTKRTILHETKIDVDTH